MPTTTINSNCTIVYDKSRNLYQQSINSSFNKQAFKKNIIYRRYVFGEDNLSGDKDFRDYNDYEIYGEIQFEGESKSVVNQGYLVQSFGYLYLPAMITKTRNGAEIPAFRPQIKDEFQFNGEWYVIENMQVLQFVNSAFSIECLFRLISTGDNPR